MSAFVRCIASAAAGLLVSFAAHDAHAQSACTIPGFDQAAFGDVEVNVGNGCTDSFDSSVAPGTYAGTRCSPDASCVGGVATNGSGPGSIDVNNPNGCVKGGCTTGPGGSVTDISDATRCNGTTVAGSAVPLPSVTVPALPAAAPFDPNGDVTLTKGFTYGTLDANNYTVGSGCTAAAPCEYVAGTLKLAGNNDKLTVASGPIRFYITGDLDLTGGGVINAGGKATDLIFMCADTVTSVKLAGGANAAFGLYCPKADIVINGGSTLYGAIVGRTVTFNGNGTMLHYDKALGSATSGAITCPPVEVSRAQPIIASMTCAAGQCGSAGAGTYDAVFQGTFESTSTARTTISAPGDITTTWTFPWIKGHMRARDSASIGTTASKYNTGTILFDAAASGKIPAAASGCSTFTGACRQIFTNTNSTPANGVTRYPSVVSLDASPAVADVVGPMIAPASKVPGIASTHWQSLMTKILGAGLGGVDRSTVAVIEASSLAAAANRPTIVYYGGTDGMLHATCASVGGSSPTSTNICPAMGTEIWAFMPRAQLPLIRTNESRIEGSVHVVDAFGDFQSTQTGKRSWRTILTFQTGYTKASEAGTFPAAYALDVTDPANPKLLWEVTTPTAPNAADFGTGADVAAGPTLINGTRFELAVLETNNGGTGGSGVFATAINMELGTRKWSFEQGVYPTADGVPATGLPGGAVPIDLNETGYISDYIFADLYGRVWRVDAATGVSVTGASTPLFKFSALYKPIGGSPALWRITSGGALYVAFASGGYMDHDNTAWASGTQYIAVAKVKPTGGTFPLDETAPALTGNVRMVETLSTGYGSYSSPTIVGDQLFVVTDTGNVNAANYGTTTTATGRVVAVDLQGVAATTSIVVAGGAAALAQKGTTLYASGNNGQVQLSSAATTAAGQSVDATSFTKTTRNLWLRTE